MSSRVKSFVTGFSLIAGTLSALVLLFTVARAQPDNHAAIGSAQVIPGPFISRPDVMVALGRISPDGDCDKSGPLVFGCLIEALAMTNTHERVDGIKSNPFNLKVAEVISDTILSDLKCFHY